MNRSLWKPAACALIALATATAARADLYIPTKTADTDDGACTLTDCSLREALDAANDHPGPDAILVRTGSYALTLPSSPLAHLEIRGDLTLVGDGAGRTVIDGLASNGIFFLAGGVTAEIREVSLRNGKSPGAGGAIHNDGGNLTLLRVEVKDNASVAGSRGAGLGGGVSSPAGTLTIRDSFFGNNSAADSGGGLYAGGTVTIANVTFDNNRAALGGAIHFASSVRGTVNNATITSNTAQQGGGLYIQNTPFVDLAPRVTNTILTGNTATGGGPDCFGPFNSSYNVVGTTAGCNGPSAATHDLIGPAAQPLNLGVLAFNGGPTLTRALTAGSKAIDAGNPAAPGSGNGACEATDQRGAPRPGGARCDIGAFEVANVCLSGGGTLCLNENRFRVTATWQTADNTGPAIGVPLTSDGGYFYFFDPTNPEITIKVLDACIVNNKYWVFASGLTNLGVTLNVTDTQTGATKTYTNPRGRTFRTILDSAAFPCP